MKRVVQFLPLPKAVHVLLAADLSILFTDTFFPWLKTFHLYRDDVYLPSLDKYFKASTDESTKHAQKVKHCLKQYPKSEKARLFRSRRMKII